MILTPSDRVKQIVEQKLIGIRRVDTNDIFGVITLLQVNCEAIAQMLDETGLVSTDEGWLFHKK